MFFLDHLYVMPNSTTGADSIFLQALSAVPLLTPMLLFFVFVVVFLGGIIRQKVKTGTADYSAWAIIASVSTLLPTLLFSVTAGFIRLDWLLIVVTLNILSAIWFFLDRKITEV